MLSEGELLAEVRRCQFCGFCEYVCPTYAATRERHYGPRGRINLILMALTNGGVGEEALRGVATCLHCKACDFQCPAGIQIAEVIRSFKALYYRRIAQR